MTATLPTTATADERIAELREQQNQVNLLLARLDQLTSPDNPELDPAVLDAENPAPWPSAPDADTEDGVEATTETKAAP